MELKDLKPQGSQLKTVRQRANIVKGWVLQGVDKEWLRELKKNHPAEFFRGMISCLPKDVDLEVGQNLIEVIRHLTDDELKKQSNEKNI